jgi:hypothetical protein
MYELAQSQVNNLCIVAALGVFLAIVYMVSRRANEMKRFAYRLILQKKLPEYDFFHSVLTEKQGHIVDGCRVWCDATYTVVVQHKATAIALIGFELSGECLSIYQLQGIRGKKLFGIDLGPFLLEKAELIARALGKVVVRVQTARLHTYYDLDESHSLYPQLYRHQARLRALYDDAAAARGYEKPSRGYAWWHKTLRKRITLKRFLRLSEIRFNRRAKASYRFLWTQDSYSH